MSAVENNFFAKKAYTDPHQEQNGQEFDFMTLQKPAVLGHMAHNGVIFENRHLGKLPITSCH